MFIDPGVLGESILQALTLGVLLVGLSLLLAWLCYLLMTALPALATLRAKVADR